VTFIVPPMDLLSRLSDLVDRAIGSEPSQDHDLPLTAAALLMLVARIDGQVLEVEERALHALISARFGIPEGEIDRLLATMDKAELDLHEPSTLVRRIVQDMPVEERGHLLALAYQIAAVDGVMHDFEEDLIWRLGARLGLTEAEIASARERAVEHLIPGKAHER
jgi:uncharacterized tellurite resistance protein B-like protein